MLLRRLAVLYIFFCHSCIGFSSKIITKSLQKILSKKQIALYLLKCHRLMVVTINSLSHEPNIALLQKSPSHSRTKKSFSKIQIFFLFYPLLFLNGPHIFILFLLTYPFHSQTKYFPIFTLSNISPDFLGAAVTKQPEKDYIFWNWVFEKLLELLINTKLLLYRNEHFTSLQFDCFRYLHYFQRQGEFPSRAVPPEERCHKTWSFRIFQFLNASSQIPLKFTILRSACISSAFAKSSSAVSDP